MVPKEIKLVDEQGIVNFYKAFSECDFETMFAMLHEECSLEFPGSSFPNCVSGRENIIELFKNIQLAMGNTLRFHPKWVLFKDDMTAIHWFTTGKPAHGGSYMNRGVAWYKLKDGLIYEFQDFFDTEIISAFWPDGFGCDDFSLAEQKVERLKSYATTEALERLEEITKN